MVWVKFIMADNPNNTPEDFEQKGALADKVVSTMGSWRFIIFQSIFLLIWMAFNVVGWSFHWDPYPFVFMNLMLSMQAAYAAPLILMSQNRQVASDRRQAALAYLMTQETGTNVENIIEKLVDIEKDLDEDIQSLVERQEQKEREEKSE